MTHPACARLSAIHMLCLGLLGLASLSEVGCVSQHAYEQLKAETLELNRTLETVQEDIKELDQQIIGLQATNRREDEAAATAQAAAQRGEEELSVLKEQAGHKLGLLQTQITQLVSQSRQLAKQIAQMRHESVSLQAMSVQYKREVEEAQAPQKLMASNATTPTVTQGTISQGTITQKTAPLETTMQSPSVQPSTHPPTDTPSSTPPPASAVTAPQQVAQADPVPVNPAPSKPATPPRPVKAIPPPVDDSWIGMIIAWLTAFWNWLLS